jgi:hypothetical protein
MKFEMSGEWKREVVEAAGIEAAEDVGTQIWDL